MLPTKEVQPRGRTLKCSATNQDSNAENSNDVATPQSSRPTKRMLKLLKCFVKQPIQYVATYVSAAFLRPLQHETQHVWPQASAHLLQPEPHMLPYSRLMTRAVGQ